MSQIPVTDCTNKDTITILSLLLELVVIDSVTGLWSINTSGSSSSGDSAVSLSGALTAGDNVFVLTKTPKLIQVYTVSLAGKREILNVNISFIGPILTINSGEDYTNVEINYI